MDACRHPTLRHSDYHDGHLLRRKEGLSDVKNLPCLHRSPCPRRLCWLSCHQTGESCPGGPKGRLCQIPRNHQGIHGEEPSTPNLMTATSCTTISKRSHRPTSLPLSSTARKSLLLRYLHELLRWFLNIIGVPVALDVEGQGDLIYSDI